MDAPLPPACTRDDLYATFLKLAASTSRDVPGVMYLNSGNPGPIVGLTVMTHGNEPAGLAAAKYAMDLAESGALRKGQVWVVINNLEAAQRYWNAQTFEENRASRFIDLNMNRLPEDTLSRTDDHRSEIRRAQALAPIWKQFEVGFDIHSTSQPSEPMIVEISAQGGHYMQGFPITKVIRNIVPVQLGKPASAFYGASPDMVTLEIEAGSHESPAALQLAATCMRSLLIRLDMASGSIQAVDEQKQIFEVCGSLLFPDTSYALTRFFPLCGNVQKDEIVAVGNGPDLVSPYTGHTLFAPKVPKPYSIEEEVFFYTKPMYVE